MDENCVGDFFFSSNWLMGKHSIVHAFDVLKYCLFKRPEACINLITKKFIKILNYIIENGLNSLFFWSSH